MYVSCTGTSNMYYMHGNIGVSWACITWPAKQINLIELNLTKLQKNEPLL